MKATVEHVRYVRLGGGAPTLPSVCSMLETEWGIDLALKKQSVRVWFVAAMAAMDRQAAARVTARAAVATEQPNTMQRNPMQRRGEIDRQAGAAVATEQPDMMQRNPMQRGGAIDRQVVPCAAAVAVKSEMLNPRRRGGGAL